MRYVTYDELGNLTGCYLQDVPPEHEGSYIEVTEDVSADWPNYRANEARDGVEQAPLVPPIDPAPIVPESVAMWQARAILIEDDLLDDVNDILAAIPDEKSRKLAQAKFEYSSTVRRDDPLVTQVIPQLGETEAEIDNMFIRAAGL